MTFQHDQQNGRAMRKNQSAEAAASEQTENAAGALTYEYGSMAEKHDEEDSYSDSFDASEDASRPSEDGADKKKGAFGLKLPSRKPTSEGAETGGAAEKSSLSLTETLREKIAASQRQLSHASGQLTRGTETVAKPSQAKASLATASVKAATTPKPEKKADSPAAAVKAPPGAFGLKPPPKKEEMTSNKVSIPRPLNAASGTGVDVESAEDIDDEFLPDIRRGGARPTSYPKRSGPAQPPASSPPASHSIAKGPFICGAALMLLGGTSALVWRQFVPPLQVTEVPSGVADLSAYQGKLIVVSGVVETDSPLRDKVFAVEDNALALKRTAEVYQWNETGQGKIWSESLITAPAGYENPTKLYFESQEWSASEWRLGGALLPDEFRRQIPVDYDKKPLGKSDYSALSDEAKKAFKLFDGAFMWVKDELNPDVGSIRISYESVPVPQITVLGTVRSGVFSPFQSGAFRAALVKPGKIPLAGMIAGMKLPADPEAEKFYRTLGFGIGGLFFVIGALTAGIFGRRKAGSGTKDRPNVKEAPAKRGALPPKPARHEQAEAPAERQKILFGAGKKNGAAAPLKDLPPLPEEATGTELKRASDPGTRLPESVHANALYDMATDLKNIPQGIEIIGLDATASENASAEDVKSARSGSPEGLEPLDLPDFDSAGEKQNVQSTLPTKADSKPAASSPLKAEIKKPVSPLKIKPAAAKSPALRPLSPSDSSGQPQESNPGLPKPQTPTVTLALEESTLPDDTPPSKPQIKEAQEQISSQDAGFSAKPHRGIIAKGKLASLAKIGKRDSNHSPISNESERISASDKTAHYKSDEAPLPLRDSTPPAAAPLAEEEHTENTSARSEKTAETARAGAPSLKSLKNRIKIGAPAAAAAKVTEPARAPGDSEAQALSVTDAFTSVAAASLVTEHQSSQDFQSQAKTDTDLPTFEFEIEPAQPTQQPKQEALPDLPAFEFEIEPAQPTQQPKQEALPDLPTFEFEIEPAQPTQQPKQEALPDLPAFEFEIEPAQPTEQLKQEALPDLPAFEFEIEPAQPTEQSKQEALPDLPAFEFEIEPAQPTEQPKQEALPDLPAFEFEIEPAQPTEISNPATEPKILEHEFKSEVIESEKLEPTGNDDSDITKAKKLGSVKNDVALNQKQNNFSSVITTSPGEHEELPKENVDDFDDFIDEMLPFTSEIQEEIPWQSFTETALYKENHERKHSFHNASLSETSSSDTITAISTPELSSPQDAKLENREPELGSTDRNADPKVFEESREIAFAEPDDDLPPLAQDLSFINSNQVASEKKPKRHEALLTGSDDDVPPLLVVH